MKAQRVKNFILVLSALLIAVFSIWLPGFFMKKNIDAQFTDIKNVPGEYYSGPSESIIKNASKQLTYSQKIQLILGMWESTITETTEEACNLSEFGIKTIVVNRIEDLHSRGLYPITLSEGQNNWYTWNATPYRALDTTFNAYAAVYWDITFTKFDNTEAHRFIVTESGDILYAEANFTDDVAAEFEPKMTNCSYLFYYYGEFTTTLQNTENLRVITHDNVTTTYRINSATDAELKKLDTGNASSFISYFKSFTPDNVFSIYQSSGSDNDTSMSFYASFKKTDNSYQMLILPK